MKTRNGRHTYFGLIWIILVFPFRLGRSALGFVICSHLIHFVKEKFRRLSILEHEFRTKTIAKFRG